ncbi:MAG: hypothetical protein ACOC33_03075 [bacterium]
MATKKIILTESQFKKLIKSQKIEKELINNLNEALKGRYLMESKQQLTEADLNKVLNTIKNSITKGLTAVALMNALAASPSFAKPSETEAQNIITSIQKGDDVEAIETLRDVEKKEAKKVTMKMEQLRFDDNIFSVIGENKSKLDSLAQEYADWKSEQSNKVLGNDLQLGIVGTSSMDISRPIAQELGQDTAIDANEYLAKLRASEVSKYLLLKITDIMRNEKDLKNFKIATQTLADGSFISIGYKTAKEGDINQNAFIFMQYGDDVKTGTAKKFVNNFVGTAHREVRSKGEVSGHIETNSDLKSGNIEALNAIFKYLKSGNKRPDMTWLGN